MALHGQEQVSVASPRLGRREGQLDGTEERTEAALPRRRRPSPGA